MNRIVDDKINSCLQQKYKQYVSKYSEQSILGVFITGNANYGFADSTDELIYTIIYMPSFEDICTKEPFYKIIDDKEKFIDIRCLYEAATADHDYSLELLFCTYKVISTPYRKVFQDFEDNAHIAANVNQRVRITKALERARKAWSHNDHFEVARLLISAEMYLEGASIYECFHLCKPYQTQYLQAVKDGVITLDHDETFNKFEELLKKSKDENNEAAAAAIRSHIMSMVGVSLQHQTSKEDFISDLTDTELSALEYVKSYIEDGEGNVSISKLIEDSSISRPVFKNLFTKLEKNKVAEVTNQGVKGTHIKFLTDI